MDSQVLEYLAAMREAQACFKRNDRQGGVCQLDIAAVHHRHIMRRARLLGYNAACELLAQLTKAAVTS